MDALAQAQAAKNSGGIVIVQVKRLLDQKVSAARDIRIPGFLVDYVVLADEEDHPQTYGTFYNPGYTGRSSEGVARPEKSFPLAKEIIAHRAAIELGKHPGANVNLGIGIPALIGAKAQALGLRDFTLSVESGLIGGVPDEGLSFGAVMSPDAIMEQSALFDFYDGGGLDLAFLGFAEADADGNVNVSHFNGRLVGSGGFINISQSARKIVFCGTLTANGLQVATRDGKLFVQTEGQSRKFLSRVSHLTFNGLAASMAGKEVLFITERAVFAIERKGLHLIELAPGIEVQDIKDLLGFDFSVSPTLQPMPDFAAFR
jgi:propionate CoA-transferase